jgi:hypothetical protein
LVTIHLAEGQTVKQLIGEVAALAGGVRPRSVSGRFGVLVDAELAYRYLAARYAPALPLPPPVPAPEPARIPVPEPTSPPVQAPPPAPAVVVPVPGKKTTAKKIPPKAATAKGE